MMDDVGRLRDRVSKLSKHFDLAGRAIEDISTSARKVTSRGEKITALEIDEEGVAEESPEARPALVAGS